MSELVEVEFHEYPLEIEDLRKLDPEFVGALSVLCLAVDEINMFRRLFVSSRHEKIGSHVIDGASQAQQSMLLRNWSSKIYEVGYFFERNRKEKQVKNVSLREWINTAHKEFGEFKALEGWHITTQVRNESGHHYSFKEAVENLGHARHGFDFSFYTHENGGNDRYPLGESILFHARLDRRWANVISKEEKQARFEGWLQWNMDRTDWIFTKHAEFSHAFIFSEVDFKTKVHKCNVPRQMVHLDDSGQTPVFKIQATP